TAYLKAAHGEEDFTINAQGGLSAKGLDQRNERSISVVDWYAAATAAKGHIREHFGETKAMALAAYHKIVMDLGCSHSWEIAMDYNISQCELVTLCPTHDLSTLATAHVADQVTSHQIAKPKSLPLEERLLPLPCHQKSGNTLLAPNRKHFCFNWTQTATSEIPALASMGAASVESPVMEPMPDPQTVVTPLNPDRVEEILL
ncbi:hypothetical protein L208DRAFT_1257720, partial [Tricholoma matsutake]